MPRRFIDLTGQKFGRLCQPYSLSGSSVLPMSRLMIGLAGGFSANAASTTPLGAVPCAEAMVPPSRWVDLLLAYCVGKSILGVWRKRPS
jgi:hypothetical protein